MIKKIIFCIMLCVFALNNAWAKLNYVPLQFPRDDAAHFKNVPYATNNLTEWWFYNGKLTATNGRQFGYYISYFYMQSIENGKKILSPQFVLQIVDLKAQKTYAYGIFYPSDQTHFGTDKLDVLFGKNLSLQKINNAFVLTGSVKSRQGPQLTFSFQLLPTKDMLIANEKGLVDMWNDKNSYYYSYTHLTTAGTLQIGKEKYVLDSSKSLSWMDHQWGDFVVLPGETEWMWASVQLENGLELNLNIPVDPLTKQPVAQKMNIVLPNGSRIYTNKFFYTPHLVKGQRYPHQYDLEVPEIKLKLALNALSPKQDANYVWEGINSAKGTFNGAAVSGQAFTENTITY